MYLYPHNLEERTADDVPSPSGGKNQVEQLVERIQAIQKELPEYTNHMSENEQAFLEAAEEQYAILGRSHRITRNQK